MAAACWHKSTFFFFSTSFYKWRTQWVGGGESSGRNVSWTMETKHRTQVNKFKIFLAVSFFYYQNFQCHFNILAASSGGFCGLADMMEIPVWHLQTIYKTVSDQSKKILCSCHKCKETPVLFYSCSKTTLIKNNLGQWTTICFKTPNQTLEFGDDRWSTEPCRFEYGTSRRIHLTFFL